ncbi:hypothetical protein OR1_03506 [Geobacter sp. OR-1]|uniref:hypothetical protein n=1 Tax=Geobacter sp. OR-1 TaxID=1266765 RepID=UPI00054345F7|nr:hypothetical protein [Geobacter sp. OR-1]GAM11196.1 hypothetical protein OR1_03506 [Geobacter sp. OR-1]
MLTRVLAMLLGCLLASSGITAAATSKILPESDPKYRIVNAVFERLARVGNRVPPRLHILKADNWDKPMKSSFGPDPTSRIRVSEEGKFVVIDEELIDILSKLGSPQARDNALAFLLGHEFAHYAAWQSGSFISNMKKKEDRQQSEQLADRLGCWYAVEAGYDPFPVAEQSIRAIYDHYYPGKKVISDYLALVERIAIVNRVRDELAAKVPFFTAAMLLLSIDRPEEAARLFEHLARDFQSREILNNAGVAYALAAVAIPPRSKYFYPFELDVSFRYPSSSRNMYPDGEVRRNALLTKAAGLFDRAIQLDPGYATAHLNRGCVAELLVSKNKLEYHLNEAADLAKQSGNNQLLARIAIIRGITLARSGRPTEAAAAFSDARTSAESMAITNLLAIGATPELPPPAYIPDEPAIESIGGIPLSRLRDPNLIPAVGALQMGDEYDTPAVKIYRKSATTWEGVRLQIGSLVVTTVATPERYAGTSARGISIGDDRSKLDATYGRADRIISTSQGSINIYSQDNLIARISPDNRIQGWLIYVQTTK